jgi:hypothetical protein
MNRRKLFTIVAATFLSAALFTGCASANAAVIDTATAVVEPTAAGGPEAPAEAERVVIMGEIVETIGNMITLNLMETMEAPEMTEEELAEMRERMEQNGGAQFSEEDMAAMRERFPQNGGGTEMTDEEREALRERFEQNGGAGAFPGGENGAPGRIQMGEDGMPEGMPEGFTFEMPEGMPEGFAGGGRGRRLTGESKDIIIPAGAPILELSYTDSGEPAETEISLEKLKAGDILQVTYASDNETVAKVVKQPSTATVGRVFNGDENGGMPGEDGGMFFFSGGPGEGGPGMPGVDVIISEGGAGN